MLIHIKNENESAAIDTLGAELVSFMGDDGFEHIWQGDKTYWGGHAPVLFPIVGALRDNRTCINGEWYEMKRHGVARHEEFTSQSRERTTSPCSLRRTRRRKSSTRSILC